MDTTTRRRPYRSSIEVRRLAVLTIIKEVAEWLADEPDDHLEETLAKHADSDGYQFACNLDRAAGWSPDADLVEILSGYNDHDAWKKVCRDYVSMYGVTVPYGVGEEVSFRGAPAKIVRVDADVAQVVVQPLTGPEVKRFGDDGGYVVNAEDVTPVGVSA